MALEDYWRNHSLYSASNWTNVCVPWVKEVQNDPVFCPDDELTKYCWLYDLGGLNKNQKADLKRASESYLTRRQMLDHSPNDSTSGINGELKSIDRQGDLDRVLQRLRKWNIFGGRNLAIQVDIYVP